MIKHDGRTVGVTSPKDRSGLKKRWIDLPEDALNAVEAEFIFNAQKKYLHGNVLSAGQWFNISFLFKVHREMLSPVWEWAGIQRTTEKNIGVKAYMIQPKLVDLCRDVIYWNAHRVDLTTLEQACLIHHRLALIHPFEDGNGRFSRLIADRYLKGCKHAYPIWPADLHQDCTSRTKYIEALCEADEGNLDPLVRFTKIHIG